MDATKNNAEPTCCEGYTHECPPTTIQWKHLAECEWCNAWLKMLAMQLLANTNYA